ncbi:GntR family transcriptional regulator / MocR family aminotransferase [Klenkia soli]|uniref:GntR family transcriptional regulator / MocR family aminotransferase n=1 Tax=Klenkia soli TaxID=1052260 RepID=A0A1H0FVC6_9ACTN|nr:PLP-dependent aminotransferase family protein [Klenkia soli]SDN98570.1 GntR family transcriptional regulator / MocR family aminotransferase [Klenkia soli]
MAGSDFLQLDIGQAPPRGTTDWLTHRLRTAITTGQLSPGTLLPSSRTLADELGIARGTVVECYQRLAEQGLTTARVGDGTRTAPLAAPAPARTRRTSSRAVGRRRFPLPPDPAITLDLTPGRTDLGAFPRAAWLRAERAVLAGLGSADLGYGDPAGHPRLRHALADWLARTRGVRTTPDELVVVGGVAQTLALTALTLRRRGHTSIGVEDPGSGGAADELQHWQLDPVPVPVDDDGLRVDRLGATDTSVVLVTPAHQFPTGVLLAPHRRRELLDWARHGDRLVIEDDYDAEHRYDRQPTPALQPAAPDHVLHTGSMSKTLAPALRLGWAIPPAHLLADLLEAKHASDLGSPVLPQLTLATLLADGTLEGHLRGVRRRNRARRDALVAALAAHLPHASIGGIAAGLHLTVTLDHPDDTAIADHAAQLGLRVHALSWHRRTPGPPGLVLGYAAHTPDQLTTAAQLLATAVDRSR